MTTQGTLSCEFACGEIPYPHDSTLNTNEETRVVVVRPPHHIETRGFRLFAVDGDGAVLAPTHTLVVEDIVGSPRHSNCLMCIIDNSGSVHLERGRYIVDSVN